jgi:hypothetical protein
LSVAGETASAVARHPVLLALSIPKADITGRKFIFVMFVRCQIHIEAMMKCLNRVLAIILLFALSGCVTPYAASGWTAGYKEEQISGNTYRVTFSGNGNTSGDMVWNYWLYRCAEFTRLKGYDVIVLVPDLNIRIPSLEDQIPQLKKQSDSIDQRARLVPAVMDGNSEGRMVKTHGGHGGGGYTPHYMYIPGGTITTYRKTGIIAMFHESDKYDRRLALRVQPILDVLKPYVDSGGKSPTPTRLEILRKSMIQPLPPGA